MLGGKETQRSHTEWHKRYNTSDNYTMMRGYLNQQTAERTA